MNVKNLSDQQLIQRVQNRDQDAFAELIARYSPRMWSVIRANARQHQDAEEIQTDIWMAVWKNIKDLRNLESFGAWLHRIAYNACRRYYTIGRQSRNEIPHETSVILEQLDEHAAARYREYQLIADIREAVHHLPQKLRDVAKLFYLESWQIKEIATEFNIPIGTVKSKLREIRALLRKEFDPAQITAPIGESTMSTQSVQPENIKKTSMKTITPAIFNADPNDPTGDNWRLPEGVYARFGKGKVNNTKLTPDGAHFAVGTVSGLWWYDVATMRPISLWDDPQGCVFNFDFSSDGKWIILTTVGHTIKVMEVESGESLLEIKGQNCSGSFACSSNGKWIAIADKEGHVRVLDIHTGEQIAQMDRGEHKWKTNDINSLNFTPDGALLVANAENPKMFSEEKECLNPDTEGSQIYVWEPQTGKPRLKFAGDTFELSPDSRFIAHTVPDPTSNEDDTDSTDIAVWDIAASEQIAYFTEHTDRIRSVTFSPCGKFIASSDDILLVWEISTGSVQRVAPNMDEPFYSDTGQLYAIRDITRPGGYAIDVWHVEENERILEILSGVGGYWFNIDLAKAYTNHLIELPSNENGKGKDKIPSYEVVCEREFFEAVRKLVWIDDHTLVACCWDGIVLLDVDKKVHIEHRFFNDYIADFVVMSSEETMVLHCHNDVRHKTWRLRTHKRSITEIPVPDEILDRSCGLELSPKGDQIACGCDTGNIYLWNIDDPKNPSVLKGHTGEIYVVTFSPDGQRLLSFDNSRTVRVWDLTSCQEVSGLTPPWPYFFSPCGDLIASRPDNEVRILDAHTFTTLQTIPLPKPRSDGVTFALSHCRQYLAGALWYQQDTDIVSVWEVETGEKITDLHGQTDIVAHLNFSPNSKLLSGLCIDGTIVLWDWAK